MKQSIENSIHPKLSEEFKGKDAKILRDPNSKIEEKTDSFEKLIKDEKSKADRKISKRKMGFSVLLVASFGLMGALALLGVMAPTGVLVAFLCAPMAKVLGDAAISKFSDSGKKIARQKNKAYQLGLNPSENSKGQIKSIIKGKWEYYKRGKPTESMENLIKARDDLQNVRIERITQDINHEIESLRQSAEQRNIAIIDKKLLDNFGIANDKKTVAEINALTFENKIDNGKTKDFIAEQVADLRDDTKTPKEKATARKILDEIFKEYENHKSSSRTSKFDINDDRINDIKENAKEKHENDKGRTISCVGR